MKAFTGFSAIKSKGRIVTGGWGCGVYNGDFVLKVVIQWIAASMAGKDIVICPFGRKEALYKSGIIKLLKDRPLGEAYALLCKAGNLKCKENIKEDIVEVMHKILSS